MIVFQCPTAATLPGPVGGSTLHLGWPRDGSDSGLIRGLLQELGREEGVGHGVRAPRGWDHQADFLVGPSPLRVQLAVVAERDLAGEKAALSPTLPLVPERTQGQPPSASGSPYPEARETGHCMSPASDKQSIPSW